MLLAYALRAAHAPRGERTLAIAAARCLAPDDLALADQPRRELRSASIFATRTAQNECSAAVLDDGLRLGDTVGTGDLGDGLKPQHAPAAELTEPRQRILEALYRSQCI